MAGRYVDMKEQEQEQEQVEDQEPVGDVFAKVPR